MDLKQQILHIYRVDEMSLAGGKALQGACAPTRKGRGTGPVGYKLFAIANDAGDNGRGRNGAQRSGVPLECLSTAGLTTEHKTEVAPFLMRPLLTM